MEKIKIGTSRDLSSSELYFFPEWKKFREKNPKSKVTLEEFTKIQEKNHRYR